MSKRNGLILSTPIYICLELENHPMMALLKWMTSWTDLIRGMQPRETEKGTINVIAVGLKTVSCYNYL